jgi:hypothetical protein
MKKIVAGLILPILLSAAVYSQSPFSYALTGEYDREKERFSSLLDLEAEGATYRVSWHWEDRERWNLAGDIPFLRAGPLSPEGIYDLVDSSAFSTIGLLKEQGRIALDRKGNLLSRGGISLFNSPGSLILHSLFTGKYSQTGILWQPGGGENLSFAGGLFASWDLYRGKPSDSWYSYDRGRPGSSLVSGLGKIQYSGGRSTRKWTLAAGGSVVFARNLLPGYGADLYFEKRISPFLIGLDLRVNRGHWRSSSGEPALWSEGAALQFSCEPEHFPSFTGKIFLYTPGVLTVPPGEMPQSFPVNWKGKGTVTAGILSLLYDGRREGDDRIPKSAVALSVKDGWGGLEGTGEIRREWGQDENVRFTGKGVWTRDPVNLGGKLTLEWERGSSLPGSSWEIRSEWGLFPTAVLELYFQGAGRGNLLPGGKLKGGLVFQMGNQ